MNKNASVIVLPLLLALLLAACGSSDVEETVAPVEEVVEETAVEYHSDILASFSPLPVSATREDYELTDELVDLGRILYYEDRLSMPKLGHIFTMAA